MGNRYLCCVLVLLILSNKILHVRFEINKLHLVHTLLRVPVQESLALEHGDEVVTDMLEELLDGDGVAKDGNCYFNTTWQDITLLRGRYWESTRRSMQSSCSEHFAFAP